MPSNSQLVATKLGTDKNAIDSFENVFHGYTLPGKHIPRAARTPILKSFPCINSPQYCISLFLLQFNGYLRIVSMYSKMTLIWCGWPYLPQSEGLFNTVLYLMNYHWRQRHDIFNCERTLSFFGVGIISCLNLQVLLITVYIFIINSCCLSSDVVFLLLSFMVEGTHNAVFDSHFNSEV